MSPVRGAAALGGAVAPKNCSPEHFYLDRRVSDRYSRANESAGLRLSELVRLPIKDVDVERGTVTVRQRVFLHVATGANGLGVASPLDSLGSLAAAVRFGDMAP